MKVLISPSIYTDPNTGLKSQSNVYHLFDYSNHVGNRKLIEVDEDQAILFGRTLCKSCELLQKREELLERLFNEVPRQTFLQWVEAMGEGFEIRVLWHSSSKKTPIVVWSTLEEETP